MKKKITFIFHCIALIFLISSSIGAQEVPEKVTLAAEEGLSLFLEMITEKNEIPDDSPVPPPPPSYVPTHILVSFGFNEDDNLDEVYLGKPFKYYRLLSDSILNYVKGCNVESMLSETDIWYFPVMLNEDVKSILTVAIMNGVWEAVGFGQSRLASELGKIMKKWPSDKGYRPLLIATPGFHNYLFTIPQYDSTNLTRLKLDGGKDYSKLENSEEVIESIKQRINNALENHPEE